MDETRPGCWPGTSCSRSAAERRRSRIRDRTGLSEGSLARTLRVLTDDKRVLLAQRPLSARRSRAVQYLVSDAYLRFWLRFIAPGMEQVLRGRGEVIAELEQDR